MAAKNDFNLLPPLLITLLGAFAWLKFRAKMQTRLSKNFTLDEFKSADGAEFPADVVNNLRQLAKNLQVIRDHFQKPIKINSGWRSPEHNKKVGGVSNSQHVKGKAADIVITGVTPGQLAAELEKLIEAKKISQGGIGVYPNFVHYDIRGKKARW
jgi:uncharacterized protein YcbK (DUF882 family)